jgi:hypothetical protein
MCRDDDADSVDAVCVLQATRARSQLLEFIQQESGVATLLDVRRTESYDAAKTVDVLLNSSEARQWMGVSNEVRTAQCSRPLVEWHLVGVTSALLHK